MSSDPFRVPCHGNLPPGVTDRMIEEAAGVSDGDGCPDESCREVGCQEALTECLVCGREWHNDETDRWLFEDEAICRQCWSNMTPDQNRLVVAALVREMKTTL